MSAVRAPGTFPTDNGKVLFRVWAPSVSRVELKLLQRAREILLPMKKVPGGYFEITVRSARPGSLYFYRLDGKIDRPDPASRSQPRGVHGPSAVVAPDFPWTDRGWKGTGLRDYIFYEVHTGTFTRLGTFDALITKLSFLKKLGITCLEIMPVAQFPGGRNWGYDGVGLYAPHSSYGGPAGLKRLVDACHRQGLAVCLDVVYNHLGPEGNYLHDYGPYFTKKYSTPWGDAVNFDGPGSDEVRRFFIENALYWVRDFHIDALRLDAIHGIYDFGASHILTELSDEVRREGARLGRSVHVIGESDLNDSRYLRPPERNGIGLDAVWADDFHHSLHVTLTGEGQGYYEDFTGLKDLARAWRTPHVYDGRYSRHRRRRHGNSAEGLGGEKFVVSLQNHDQVGNRARGDRLSGSLSFSQQKIAAVALLLSPYVPLIFMGQEYGETAPFPYFVDHSDAALLEAVRNGRRKEFESFGWKEVPDPASGETFASAKLNLSLAKRRGHREILRLYRDLVRLRREWNFLPEHWRENIRADHGGKDRWLRVIYRRQNGAPAALFISFEDRLLKIPLPGNQTLRTQLDTEDRIYGGRSSAPAKYSGYVKLNPFSAVAGLLQG